MRLKSCFVLVFFVLSFVCASSSGCSEWGDDDDTTSSPTPEATPTPTLQPAEDFVVQISGQYAGVSNAVVFYGMDDSGCQVSHVAYVFVQGEYNQQISATCDTIGEGINFSMDMSSCAVDPRAQRIIQGCGIDQGDVDDIRVTFTPTYDPYLYPESSPLDGYGDFSLHATLPDGSTLTVDGNYSHCSGGQPCDGGMLVSTGDVSEIP